MVYHKVYLLASAILLTAVFYVNLLFSTGYFDPPTHQPRYTTFKCLGGTDMELWRVSHDAPDERPPKVDYGDMQCYFENLHLMENSRFLFFYERKVPPRWLRTFFHVRGLHLEFTRRVISTRSEPRALAVVFSTCRPVGYPNGANTPGHDFDYIFTAFRSMLNFGMGPGTQIYVHPVSSRSCQEIQSKFWHTLGYVRPDFFNIRERVVLRHVLVAQKKKHEAPMVPPDTSILRQYVDHALDSLRIDSSRPTKYGLQNKGLRHRFLNFQQIASFLRIGGKHVVDMRSYQKASAREEIQAVRDLDVYVSPPGGVSLSALFMRPRTQLVLGRICWPLAKAGGELQDAVPVHVATDFNCHRSDNLLWDSVSWFDVHYVGPARVNDLLLEATTPKYGPWVATTNAFSYSYNVSIPQLNRRLLLKREEPLSMINVVGYMKSGAGLVAEFLAKEYPSSTLISAPHLRRPETNYLLHSRPTLNLFHTCTPPAGYLPSVAKFACRDFVCREEVRDNFLRDVRPYTERHRRYVISHTPTLSLLEMEKCFSPDILHFFTLRHPMYWSQAYHWRDFQSERGNLTEQLYSTYKTIQTLRMFLEVKPVQIQNLYFVRFEQEVMRRRRLQKEETSAARMFGTRSTQSWVECTKTPSCNHCLVYAQESLGLFGYDMLNPWEPLKKYAQRKMQAFKYAHYLPTLRESERRFRENCL